MRPLYALLLAIATTFLASGSAATAPGRITDVSAKAPPELTGMGQTIGNEKRSLRYHQNDERAEKEEEDEHDNDDEKITDGEERTKGSPGANLFTEWKLNQMMASLKRKDPEDIKQLEKRFERWKPNGYKSSRPFEIVDQPKYDALRKAYNHWKKFGNIPV
ncbi:Secreted RxLR effector peptide protein [Phytophthora palmivora]|uniref:RxLR effector protein n=1 Tax=Phytophthora palmivora TaxID=4796 RepID=A0A2P4X3R6_9STRA|nr:Secreted RxLR effector peptide protein [Phytophthora palmivora]